MTIEIDLTGRTAFVTGSARGIGRATALRLAEAGADLVLHYRSHREEAERTLDDVRRRGVRAGLVQCDLAAPVFSAMELWAAVDEVALRETGAQGVDVLISNAGADLRKPLEDFAVQEIDELFRVNTIAPLVIAQHGAAHLRDGGSIVLVSSTASWHPLQTSIPYGVAKAGVNNLTTALAELLAPRRIRVNAVAPGAVRTGMQRDRQRLATLERAGVLAEPDDIARVALFLASPLASWVNGTVLAATGKPVV